MKLKLKTIFLLLTIVMATLFIWPELNYQDLLAQGDHGRDLYAFDVVTHGQLPYKDFWWVYGPLMPYYYGLFFKIFGVHITSVLLGRALLVILCSISFYLAAVCFMSPVLAFLAATWFTQGRPEFFFTYNHIGGILMELIILWGLLSYILNGRPRYLWITLAADFILGLIKINFGLAGLVGIILGVLLIDLVKKYPFDGPKKKFYIGAVIVIPALLGIIYWLLLHGLPLYAIRQCMPYFGDDQPYHIAASTALRFYLMQNWISFIHPWGMAIGIVMHGCTLYSIYLLISGKLDKTYRQNVLLALTLVWAFFVLYFHEYLVSGVWYRSYWSLPFLDFFQYVTIGIAWKFIPKFLRVMILLFLGALTLLGVVAHIGVIQSQKQPYRYLAMDRGHIYVGNEPQWTDTVNKVTYFLSTTLKKDDQFFAMPYDCLYYYLTGKNSPTRQLIFFDHIKIPQQQEISVIQELEKNRTVYVLMSNRIKSDETGLGVFGQTYCPLLAQYINQVYAPLARQGGDWTQAPGWANNHGVIILKRKSF